jgi:hypothetical protein
MDRLKVLVGIFLVCGLIGLAAEYAPKVNAQALNPVTLVPPWSRFQATGDLDNSTDVSLKAAATGKVYCATSIQISAQATLGAAVNVRLLSNDTVIWNFALPTTGGIGQAADFPGGVCTVAGEALEIDVSGDPTDDLIFYNVQGFTVN